MVHRPWVAAVFLATLVACRPAVDSPRENASAQDLFAAARAGDLEEARRVLESGVPVDVGDRYEATALAMAAGAGHLEMVRLLLERGGDPNHRETFYDSAPLDMALYGGHLEVASVLLAAGADDREGALELAVADGLPDLARAAISSGAIRESVLESLRARDDLDPEWREVLDAATSRPDPPPPDYSAEELKRFAGKFEGWSSDVEVAISVGDEGLILSVDRGSPMVLSAVADKSFRSGDESVEASFYGRAGTIEQVSLRGPGMPQGSLRRSVAEPAGPEAFHPDPEIASSPETATVNWPGFRGERAAGIGDGEDTPTTWNLETGDRVLWQVEIPGLGNSSPIVWGDLVMITTAIATDVPQEIRTGLTGEGTPVEEEVDHRWMVLAYRKATGEPVWEAEAGRGVPLTRRHFKATQANSTPVTDGRYLVAVFPTAGLVCLDLEGNLLWKTELGGLNAGAPGDPGMEWGYSSSPVLYGSTVILQVDVHEGSYAAAWSLEGGEEKWRTERDVVPSWSSPNLLRSDDGDELVLNGSTVHGYDPETGRELWSLGPNSELVIATPVMGEGVSYVSAGYPPVKPIYAIRAGTRGALLVEPGKPHDDLLWSHGRGGAYMPTPLLYRGLYYVVHHNGRIVAYDAESGTPIYKSRFSRGGTFTGSPVAVNGKLYVPSEEGRVYVVEAGAEYRELAINELGEPLMATPAVSEGVLFFRTPSRLVALAQSP